MDKITYTRGRSSKEPQSLTFELNPDLTCVDFRNMCVRMAYALGYANSSIEIAFPKPKTGRKNKQQMLFD